MSTNPNIQNQSNEQTIEFNYFLGIEMESQLTARTEKQMTAIENEAAKNFISKVLFAQRHRMKLWIAHGDCRPIFILKQFKIVGLCYIVVRAQNSRIQLHFIDQVGQCASVE